MIKVVGAEHGLRVIDRAIQAHGAAGCRRTFRSPQSTRPCALCASPTVPTRSTARRSRSSRFASTPVRLGEAGRRRASCLFSTRTRGAGAARATAAGLTRPLPSKLDDAALEARLFHRPRDPGARRARLLAPRRSPAWRCRRAGRASPTGPTRCASGASLGARSRPTCAIGQRTGDGRSPPVARSRQARSHAGIATRRADMISHCALACWHATSPSPTASRRACRSAGVNESMPMMRPAERGAEGREPTVSSPEGAHGEAPARLQHAMHLAQRLSGNPGGRPKGIVRAIREHTRVRRCTREALHRWPCRG